MNKEESLALFAQGRDAWNAWAAEILAEREALEAAGTWTAAKKKSEWNDATLAWDTAATVDFTGRKFNGLTDFSGFTFPGDTKFRKAEFSGGAWFRKMQRSRAM